MRSRDVQRSLLAGPTDRPASPWALGLMGPIRLRWTATGCIWEIPAYFPHPKGLALFSPRKSHIWVMSPREDWGTMDAVNPGKWTMLKESSV